MAKDPEEEANAKVGEEQEGDGSAGAGDRGANDAGQA